MKVAHLAATKVEKMAAVLADLMGYKMAELWVELMAAVLVV